MIELWRSFFFFSFLFFSKCLKFLKLRKVLGFSDNCIWIGSGKFSVTTCSWQSPCYANQINIMTSKPPKSVSVQTDRSQYSLKWLWFSARTGRQVMASCHQVNEAECRILATPNNKYRQRSFCSSRIFTL